LGFGARPGSYIEFMADMDLNISRKVMIQTRPPFNKKGYARN